MFSLVSVFTWAACAARILLAPALVALLVAEFSPPWLPLVDPDGHGHRKSPGSPALERARPKRPMRPFVSTVRLQRPLLAFFPPRLRPLLPSALTSML